MKYRSVLPIVLCAVLSIFALSNVGEIHAQGASSSVYKIGIVDLQRVMDSYDKRTTEVAKLEEEVEKRKDEIEQLKQSFETELKQFRESSSELSEDERTDREAELDRRAFALEGTVRQAETGLERKRRRLKNELLKDIVAAVTEIGDSENYHFILEASPESPTGVIYYTPTTEITPKVIEHLNSKS